MSSDDIVTRDVTDPWQEICDLRDEIERLRGLLDQEQQRRRDDLLGQQHRDDEIERLRAAIDAERALADQLADALCGETRNYTLRGDAVRALETYKEARRG